MRTTHLARFKFTEKLALLTRVRIRGCRNNSFLEKFYIHTKWMILQLKVILFPKNELFHVTRRPKKAIPKLNIRA